MDINKPSQQTDILVIRKSAALMIVKLITFELLAGFIYILLRLALRALDLELDTEFSLDPLALIKSFFFLLIEIAVAGYVILQWLNNYYIFTSREVKYITGTFTKREMNYSLSNIQSVSFEQGLIERVLNYGNIKIFSPALKQELFLTEVTSPRQIVETIKQVIEDDSGNTKFIMRR